SRARPPRGGSRARSWPCLGPETSSLSVVDFAFWPSSTLNHVLRHSAVELSGHGDGGLR
ncbi:unnamed protein product, partial [Musa hybrid cultivar]